MEAAPKPAPMDVVGAPVVEIPAVVEPETRPEDVIAAARSLVASGARFIAPSLVVAEAANVLVKRLRRRELAPTYYLEYPHVAVLLFRAGFVWQQEVPSAPATFRDGHHMSIVQHHPRDEAERRLWHSFRLATRTYVCLMTGFLLLLVLVLRRGYGRSPDGATELASSGLLLLLPSALYFSLFRFDVVEVTMADETVPRVELIRNAFQLSDPYIY